MVHPNVFKSGLGMGQGITIIPHRDGRVVKKIQFQAISDYPGTVSIPTKNHPAMPSLPILPDTSVGDPDRPSMLV